mgnify:CR=1 FL=1
MNKLVILGGRGIGMIAASIAEATGEYEVLGFLNDVEPIGSQIGKFKKYPVIGTSKDIPEHLMDNRVFFFVGYIGMKSEKEVYDKVTNLGIPRERFATLIHPTAIIPEGYCKIGKGVLIAPLAQLSPDTTIEDNCILLPNSFLGHDSTMKRFSHITTNSVVGGYVTLGVGSHIGSNATIREYVQVGDFAIVGSGSVVLENVHNNTIYVGNPARLIKNK